MTLLCHGCKPGIMKLMEMKRQPEEKNRFEANKITIVSMAMGDILQTVFYDLKL